MKSQIGVCKGIDGGRRRMNIRRVIRRAFAIEVAVTAVWGSTSCSRSLPKDAVANIGHYNYSPSAIQTDDKVQIWWCSQGVNPIDSSQNSDAIYYEEINLSTKKTYGPVLVLAETPGAWDSVYTCNPKVIGGVFENPLGDGAIYGLAMYYVATSDISGNNNSIGVAFSNDGIHWFKYPRPVIASSSQTNYGVGQPALYNNDHKAAISMYYEDSTPTLHRIAAVSTDGLHFTVHGTLTTIGLDPDDPEPTWGDMAFDSKTGEWYAVFNRPLRPPSTTGGTLERGQSGIELYKIRQDALLSGGSPWRQLGTIDTNANGFESIFIAALVHDLYGNINIASYPTIKMYTSVSYPAPPWDATPAEAGESGSVGDWILMPLNWTPGVSTVRRPLSQYFNGSVHQVTSGWIDPEGGFQFQQVLGNLYPTPDHGATVPLYSCKNGEKDYFVSRDANCEGQRVIGRNGYAYAEAVPALHLVPLYRCFTGSDHFASQDPGCEGQITDKLLGYLAP
jgi:hypothetical protein